MIESLRQELLKLQGKHKQLLVNRKQNFAALISLKKRQKYCKNQLLHSNTHLITKSEKQLENNEAKELQQSRQERRKGSNITPTKKNEEQMFIKYRSVGGELQQKERERSKRTFGLVSSYLMKAKVNLQSEQEKLKKKAQLERKVRQEQQQNMRVLREERIIAIQKQKQQLVDQKSQITKQLLDIENKILLCKYKTHLGNLDGFVTEAEPKLFWKPFKPLQQSVLQQKTDQHLKSKLLEAEKIINIIDTPQEFIRRMEVDKNEYYQSIYSKYLQSLHSFIETKTQPHIYWKPAKHNNSTIDLQKATKIRLIGQQNKPIPQLMVKQTQSVNEQSQSQQISLVEDKQ